MRGLAVGLVGVLAGAIVLGAPNRGHAKEGKRGGVSAKYWQDFIKKGPPFNPQLLRPGEDPQGPYLQGRGLDPEIKKDTEPTDVKFLAFSFKGNAKFPPDTSTSDVGLISAYGDDSGKRYIKLMKGTCELSADPKAYVCTADAVKADGKPDPGTKLCIHGNSNRLKTVRVHVVQGAWLNEKGADAAGYTAATALHPWVTVSCSAEDTASPSEEIQQPEYGGAISKCIKWGYGPSDQGAFLSCIRMARADYCGDGVSRTAANTLIDIYKPNVESPTCKNRMCLEAGWDPAGATEIAHLRWRIDGNKKFRSTVWNHGHDHCKARFAKSASGNDIPSGDKDAIAKRNADPATPVLRSRSTFHFVTDGLPEEDACVRDPAVGNLDEDPDCPQ